MGRKRPFNRGEIGIEPIGKNFTPEINSFNERWHLNRSGLS